MKRILLLLVAVGAMCLAFSCGSGSGKSSSVKDRTLTYFKALADLYEKNEISAYSDKKVEFADFLDTLGDADGTAVYEAFKTYRDSWTGQGSFNDYFSRVLWYEINTAETVAKLVPHLYAGAEPEAHMKGDADKEHPASEDLSYFLGLVNHGVSRSNEWYWDIVDPWMESISDREADYEIKRLVTAQGIGPVRIGGTISGLPSAEEGLYDYLDKQVEEFGDEGGDSWEETVYKAMYLGQEVFLIYPDYENEDIIRTICVTSCDYHTASGQTNLSWPSSLFRAGAKGFYTSRGYTPYYGVICDGLIFQNLDLSYSAERRIGAVESLGEEAAMWLGEDGFFNGLRVLKMWVPAPGQIEDLTSLIDNWE